MTQLLNDFLSGSAAWGVLLTLAAFALGALINKLTGTDSIATREIGNDDKGRHTTTHWELLQLPNGAFVIDTPGMRELGMWDSGDGIDTAFADIEELSRMCRCS